MTADTSKRALKALAAGLGLAGYTLWLLAFPMQGLLLGEEAGRALMLAFLLPHSGVLLLLALLRRPSLHQGWLNLGVLLSAAFTAAFALHELERAALVLALTGMTAAPAMLKAGSLLRVSPYPLVSAGMGLILGNACLLLAVQAVWSPAALGAVLAACLLALLQPGAEPLATETKGLRRYLPFLLLVYVAGGLRYDVLQAASGMPLMPLLPQGAPLLAYILAVLAGVALFRRDRDLTLVLGIVFGMLSFSASIVPGEAWMAFGSLCMQVSVGFVDFFVLGLLLVQPNWFRAFGLGIAVMCLGIALGELLAGWLQGASELLGMTGYSILTAAVLALYLLGRQERLRSGGTSTEVPSQGGDRTAFSVPKSILERLPPGMAAKLSSRERDVLELAVDGSSYSAIAAELGISESSVKTYMRRIFEKLGVSGKKELLARHFQQE